MYKWNKAEEEEEEEEVEEEEWSIYISFQAWNVKIFARDYSIDQLAAAAAADGSFSADLQWEVDKMKTHHHLRDH